MANSVQFHNFPEIIWKFESEVEMIRDHYKGW